MPRFLAPHKSGAHRVAGIALYRALLLKCRTVDFLEPDRRTALQNVVRNRFRKNRVVTSRNILATAFQAGYEALDLLNDSLNPSHTSSRTRLTTLLQRTPASITAPHPSPPQTQEETKYPPLLQDKPSGLLTSPAPAHSVLARPRPSVAGRRHVPHVANANGYPLLRFKKPQPHQLGAYLRKRARRKERWIQVRKDLVEAADGVARWEDEWDGLMRAQARQEGSGGSVEDWRSGSEEVEGRRDDDGERRKGEWHSWRLELVRCAYLLKGKVMEEKTRSLEMMRRLEVVVEKERELAKKEDEERRWEKKLKMMRTELESDVLKDMVERPERQKTAS